jgi:RimJ/RimL family protein N-acetyltransferase
MRGEIIYLRLFEPEDYQKTYVWHNDFSIQKTTCGPLRFVSKEIEKNWVMSKATHNQTEIYLAICLIENDEMIGWYSINNIDYLNRKCHCGGVVIGDKRYRDGDAHYEAGKLAFDYIINELNMNRITGSCLREHILSRAVMEASFWKLEGIERQSIYKGGCYHDVCRYAILRDEYLTHLNNGDYDDQVKRIAKLVRKLRKDFRDNK